MGGSNQKRSKKDLESVLVALLIALLLHVVLVVPIIYLVINVEKDGTRVFQVDFFGEPEVAEKKTPEEELEEYDPEEEIPDGQVVRAPPQENKELPEDARFLSEEDATVDQETKSRIQLPGSDPYSSPNQNQSTGRDAESNQGGMRGEDYQVPLPDDARFDESGQKPAKNVAPPSPEDVNLQPSKQAMASAVRGSGLDNMEDVVPGDMTALSTRSWRYASFFNRVKKQVEQFWRPGAEYRKNDPYGNIYGFKDRTTVILVVLRSDGSLKHAYIMDPSGAAFLDTEAKEAIQQAGPFPNVPDGLKDKETGLVKFTFHFIVDVGGQPVFRMRRYQ